MSLGEEAQCPRKFFMSSGTNMKPDFPAGMIERLQNQSIWVLIPSKTGSVRGLEARFSVMGERGV